MWREASPHVLAALLRRYGDFEACEDAVQEALLAAARQWPAEGVPDNPRAWLITVASRRLVDARRAERGPGRPRGRGSGRPAGGRSRPSERDDSLALLLLCCHPALSRPSQVALTLRAVGGLSTDRIARAFLVPESTMAQRISRAKARLREVDAPFAVPPPGRAARSAWRPWRTCSTWSSPRATPRPRARGLTDVSLADEAIRLTRRLHAPAAGASPR